MALEMAEMVNRYFVLIFSESVTCTRCDLSSPEIFFWFHAAFKNGRITKYHCILSSCGVRLRYKCLSTCIVFPGCLCVSVASTLAR